MKKKKLERGLIARESTPRLFLCMDTNSFVWGTVTQNPEQRPTLNFEIV